MKSIKATFDDVKGWAMLGLGAFVVYKFSGAFTAAGDAVTAVVQSAADPIKEKAEAKKAAAKVATTAPGATAADVANYDSDAATLVAAFGTGPGFTSSFFFEDNATAFSVLKRYSRLMLHNNAPYDRSTLKGTAVETKTSATRKVNYKVLVPFYREKTGGRDLVADAKKFLKNDTYTKYLKWIL